MAACNGTGVKAARYAGASSGATDRMQRLNWREEDKTFRAFELDDGDLEIETKLLIQKKNWQSLAFFWRSKPK